MFDIFPWLEKILPFFNTFIGKITFIPFYALWVTFLLPGVWASMLAGLIYGTVLGSFLVFCGASIGAELTFLLARTIFRDFANNQIAKRPKLDLVLKALSREGLKLIFLTRLSPAFPFSLLNLVYGLSDVSLRNFTIGLLGILPGTILFCGLGSLAGDLARFDEILANNDSVSVYIVKRIGIITTIAVFWLVGRAAKQAINQDSDLSL